MKRALWRAPELLRAVAPPPRGTQKGDVYSFGIVLFEIVGRIGPWGELNFSNEGNIKILELLNMVRLPQNRFHLQAAIIEKVRDPNETKGFFRPPIKCLDIPDYVRQCLLACWEEDPDSR